jgi:hypothetical protein
MKKKLSTVDGHEYIVMSKAFLELQTFVSTNKCAYKEIKNASSCLHVAAEKLWNALESLATRTRRPLVHTLCYFLEPFLKA